MSFELALVVASAIPATLFPILYTYWSRWWLTPEGRHLFFFTLGMAALYDLTLAGHLLGDLAWFGAAVVATLLLLCYQLWRRLWLLVKYNAPRRRRDREDAP